MATTTSSVNVSSNVRVLAAGSPDQGALSWDISTDGALSQAFTNGSGANAVNKVHIDNGTGTVNFDFDAGTLLDPLGAALTFSRIVLVRIFAPSTNAAAIAVGGDFILSKYLTGWVDDALTIPVHPGGMFQFMAPNATGVAVTASTGDVLTITAGADLFRIVILGS